MSPINHTIFPSEKMTDMPVAWSVIGFFLSVSGIIVFFIVKPTWEMYRRRVAFVKSLERQEEARAEARARASAGV
jgi:hypothetical protein